METITAAFVRQCLPRRDPEGHKGDFGKVLCICGSVGYTGAPIFASRAAVRTGAGLVFLGVPQSVWPVAAVKSDEAMPFPLPETADGKLSLLAEEPIRQRAAGCDAVLLGCGLGRDWQTDTLVQDLLNMEKPLVLDADGLNAISENAELLQKRPAVTVLTPHEGEFLRLGGDLSRGREAAAAEFSQKYGVYLILKGHRTLIADPEGRLAVNNTGNCGMAKGGSGDVLAGMLLSLLGQGCETFDACCAAVWLHGRAGDLAARDVGLWGMTPSDLLDRIPAALREVTE